MTNYYKKSSNERGAALVIGIVIMSLLVIGIGVFAYLALTTKQGPILSANPVEVHPDDSLTPGSSNNELVIDTRIIKSGIDRDQTERQAANEVMTDQALPVGDDVTPSTTVEQARLSQLQTDFITESDRRLKLLNTNAVLANKLPVPQRTDVLKLLSDETSGLTGLKAKAAAETTQAGLVADRDALDKEYGSFILALAKVRLLMWANDQTSLNQRVNILGGKFQERLNSASNNGDSIAGAQTNLNTYQTAKSDATGATINALKLILAVKPGSYESNRAVLKSYYAQLASAHEDLENVADSAVSLVVQIRSFK